MNWQHIYSRRK